MNLRRYSPDTLAVIVFAVARTLLCGYRAATQSLTVDEATTFLDYVRGPWIRIYQHYDANNHVLYSALAKLTVHWFRVSEFSVRLPSVLAGFLLIFGIWKVLEAAGTDAEQKSGQARAVRFAALLIIGLNPLLLDLSIAARGYSLGLALLMWCLYFAMRDRTFAAGVLLGLSISAMLTMVFPGAGAIAAVFLLLPGSFDARVRRALNMAIPAAAIAFTMIYPALQNAPPDRFYVGEPRLGASIFNLIFTCIRSSVTRIGLFGSGRGAHAIQYVFLPGVLVFIAAVSARMFFRDRTARAALIPALTLGAAFLGLIAARVLVGVNYPVDRIGIYLFVLLGLAWAIAAAQLRIGSVLAIEGVLAAALVLQFLTQFEPRYFSLWAFDLPAKQVARMLQQQTAGKAADSVSVSASWFQTPALEFYRYYYRIGPLKQVERHTATALSGFDFYVLNLKDDDDVKAGDYSRLVRLYQEPVSGVLLARDPAWK